jgi:hypothetical protein
MPRDEQHQPDKRRAFQPFRYGQKQRDLAEAIHQRVVKALDERRRRMISDQNALSYRHGREWSSSHNPETQEFSRFQTASAEATIPFEHILDHRLSAIPDYIARMADGLERGFMTNFFSLIDATTEKTGNVVRSSGSAAEDFFDMLSKLETGVDRYGRPTMPSIVTSPENGRRMIQELEAQPEEFHRRVEELKQKKERDATAREADRIARFCW